MSFDIDQFIAALSDPTGSAIPAALRLSGDSSPDTPAVSPTPPNPLGRSYDAPIAEAGAEASSYRNNALAALQAASMGTAPKRGASALADALVAAIPMLIGGAVGGKEGAGYSGIAASGALSAREKAREEEQKLQAANLLGFGKHYGELASDATKEKQRLTEKQAEIQEAPGKAAAVKEAEYPTEKKLEDEKHANKMTEIGAKPGAAKPNPENLKQFQESLAKALEDSGKVDEANEIRSYNVANKEDAALLQKAAVAYSKVDSERAKTDYYEGLNENRKTIRETKEGQIEYAQGQDVLKRFEAALGDPKKFKEEVRATRDIELLLNNPGQITDAGVVRRTLTLWGEDRFTDKDAGNVLPPTVAGEVIKTMNALRSADNSTIQPAQMEHLRMFVAAKKIEALDMLEMARRQAATEVGAAPGSQLSDKQISGYTKSLGQNWSDMANVVLRKPDGKTVDAKTVLVDFYKLVDEGKVPAGTTFASMLQRKGWLPLYGS